VLGWNHLVPALMEEFASHPHDRFQIDIVSEVTASKRRKRLAAEGIPEERIQISHHEFNYTVPAYLAGIDPSSYDNVLLLRSERLKTDSESDARTILAYLLLRQLTADTAGPHVFIELIDPDNSRLFENRLENEHTEIVVTSRIVSHMLARVALRRELRSVFDELFSSGGCDITFRRIADYDLAPGHYVFADLQNAATSPLACAGTSDGGKATGAFCSIPAATNSSTSRTWMIWSCCPRRTDLGARPRLILLQVTPSDHDQRLGATGE
jgi:hypothetical protein